jgi:hypothetical protein
MSSRNNGKGTESPGVLRDCPRCRDLSLVINVLPVVGVTTGLLVLGANFSDFV